ncbi:MAG: hypothetical protein HKL99_12545 [Burkholderiales bacterium]|nr:hypothetical protein [Burkholderiales bacterium]
MTTEGIRIIAERQQNPLADIYSAHIAIVRPILRGLLYSLKQQVVDTAGGYEKVPLFMLPRLRREGDGDIGICFEYAVHESLRNRQPGITERIYDALTIHCRVPGTEIDSILFAAEKNGSLQLLNTANGALTDDSRILTGARAQPPLLKQYLKDLARAFRSSTHREQLPATIKGLWKADLFIGCRDSDRWVGTSVKINPHLLEGAPGLRLAIVPSLQGRNDAIKYDENRNLVVCPIPYDASFMEVFYVTWGIVMQFLAADAYMPKDSHLPRPFERQVANELVKRRDFAVVDVIDALLPISQPHLLFNSDKIVPVVVDGAQMTPDTLISPTPAIVA